jgi:hypothetical protein
MMLCCLKEAVSQNSCGPLNYGNLSPTIYGHVSPKSQQTGARFLLHDPRGNLQALATWPGMTMARALPRCTQFLETLQA